MVDRILDIQGDGRQGKIVAEQEIRLDAWYFQCHMPGDPVQPGCLSVDAIWQLLGFFCVWRGALGSGRALGCGEVVFSGQIRPFNRLVRYEVDVRRFTHLKESGATIVIGGGNRLGGRRDDRRDPWGEDGRLQGDRLSGLPPPVGQQHRRKDGGVREEAARERGSSPGRWTFFDPALLASRGRAG